MIYFDLKYGELFHTGLKDHPKLKLKTGYVDLNSDEFKSDLGGNSRVTPMSEEEGIKYGFPEGTINDFRELVKILKGKYI